jgi:glutamate N-acetyltransferase/amino-acid N-acetyltransferase
MKYKAEWIDGAINTPKGFTAAGVACNIKKNNGLDLALIVSDIPAAACGVFTRNIVKGHSLQRTMSVIESGTARAIVINSGNANACLGQKGLADANEMANMVSEKLGFGPDEVLTGSTGVIGQPLPMDKIKEGISLAVNALSTHPKSGHDSQLAIMTTDTMTKEFCVKLTFNNSINIDNDTGISINNHSNFTDIENANAITDNNEDDIANSNQNVNTNTETKGIDNSFCISGMAKGSGMIHPNMATMISVITTDCDIAQPLLATALREITDKTFNRVSVDGDTSVCDMVVMMANGKACNPPIISAESYEYSAFCEVLEELCRKMSKAIAKDGEGASKLIEVNVVNAATKQDAYLILQSIAKSPLVKTAMFGEDANWGRILTAAGYSGANFNPDICNIKIGDLLVCTYGTAVDFDEIRAKEILSENEIIITVDLVDGSFNDTIWTCDFSYDYVRINGSYRS